MPNAVKKVGIFEPPTKPKITKEMKATMAKSGLDSAAQKKALEDQLTAAKAKYLEDMAQWNEKPQTEPQTVEALKSDLEEFKASVPKRKEEIEKTYNVLVFAVTHEYLEFGECYDFLYVSDYKSEWKYALLPQRNTFYARAYVWNKTDDNCSEFGTIGICSFGGGIKRVA